MTTQDLLRYSNDYLELVEEYWPGAQSGDLLAMTTVYGALNNCNTFKAEIQNAESIDDLDELLAHRHQNDLGFAKGIYFQCKALVSNMDRFSGWEKLQFKAALAGDIESKIWIAFGYYLGRYKHTREDLPFSPAEFLTDAMQARHPMVFGMTAAYAPAGPLKDDSPEIKTAWFLLSCKYDELCTKPESMRSLCRFQTEECTQADNMYEVYRLRAGSDEVFDAAAARAAELYVLVEAGRFDELGLELVW